MAVDQALYDALQAGTLSDGTVIADVATVVGFRPNMTKPDVNVGTIGQEVPNEMGLPRDLILVSLSSLVPGRQDSDAGFLPDPARWTGVLTVSIASQTDTKRLLPLVAFISLWALANPSGDGWTYLDESSTTVDLSPDATGRALADMNFDCWLPWAPGAHPFM